jgi:hypothetical protein
MPAESQRIQPGIYLMSLADRVTEEEIADHLSRCANAAQSDGISPYVLIVDPLTVSNPLKAARLLPTYVPDNVAEMMVLNNNRNAAVVAERVVQMLPDANIKVAPTHPPALSRARLIRGTDASADLDCDYL